MFPDFSRTPHQILIGSELDLMREACTLARNVLDYIGKHVLPGQRASYLESTAREMILDSGGFPASLNYPGFPIFPIPKYGEMLIDDGHFPGSICVSPGDVVCHGIPSFDVVLEEGDLVGIDTAVWLNGFCGDVCATFPVGNVSEDVLKFLDVSRKSTEVGVIEVQAGKDTNDIGSAIQKYVEGEGYSVVREYCGHGVGRAFHTHPQIPHFHTGRHERMIAGMCFTIEPMINMGTSETALDSDNWTVRTADGSMSAQFEHTVLVTRDGCEVLTA